MLTAAARAVARQVDDLIVQSSRITWDSLDDVSRAATIALVLDSLGLAAAAAASPSVPQSRAAFRRAFGEARIESGIHVPFVGPVAGSAAAGACLSSAIHAWDFDDTHDEAIVHTGCIAVSASLAATQESAASGARFLEGVVAGVEVVSRLALALGPQDGVIRTAGLGTIGAAAAAARVLGLNQEQTRSAIALASAQSLAPATRQAVVDSAPTKRYQPAMSVTLGITAAYLAAEGLDAPSGWWAGTYGLGRVAGDPGIASAHLSRPGTEVSRLSLKPYPTCRLTHAAITGVLALTGSEPLKLADVPDVIVRLPEGPLHALVARDFERRGTPIIDAQFSIPWLVGTALLRGRVGLPELNSLVLSDPEIEEVARKRVAVIQDQTPNKGGLTPVVVSFDSEPDSPETVINRVMGSPDHPLTNEQLQNKIEGCFAAGDRPIAGVSALVDFVQGLEHVSATEFKAHLSTVTAPLERLHA